MKTLCFCVKWQIHLKDATVLDLVQAQCPLRKRSFVIEERKGQTAGRPFLTVAWISTEDSEVKSRTQQWVLRWRNHSWPQRRVRPLAICGALSQEWRSTHGGRNRSSRSFGKTPIPVSTSLESVMGLNSPQYFRVWLHLEIQSFKR